MSLGPIRPRFSLTVDGTVDEQIARVEAAVARAGSGCVSHVLGNHVNITIVHEARHRWSPCVQLELRDADDKTVIDGLVGPHPNVWTLFAFVNITIFVAAGFGLMLGLSQWWLAQPAWGLWALPVGLALLGAMYTTSQLGQRCAADQTRQLMDLVQGALGTSPS